MANLMPKISVIMPVFNAENKLKESIDSILNQTFSDFEFLIYNDGSTDNSDEVIKAYNDPRIKYTKFENNAGLVGLLNRGISEAKGEFIARMDADDISLPYRFEEQFKFMNENPDIGFCGSMIEHFGRQSAIVNLPVTNFDINASLFFGTPFSHPTVMMRTSLLRSNNLFYDNNYLYAEDYELFERVSFFTEMSNIQKILLKYRLHETQISTKKWNRQYHLAGKIQARRFARVLNKPLPTDLEFLENYFTFNSKISNKWFELIEYYKTRIITENVTYPKELILKAVDAFSDQNTNKNIKEYLLRNYYNNADLNINLLLNFFRERKDIRKHLNMKLSAKFIAKCLLPYQK